MDIRTVQKEFPQFKANKQLHYLDTAATSLTPEPVLQAMDDYYRTYRANTHRGLYREAERATEEFEVARKKVAAFIGAERDEIVFTNGATIGSNMLMDSLGSFPSFSEGGNIVTTVMEHHALLLPFQRFVQRHNLGMKYIGITDAALRLDDFNTAITKNTKAVGVTLASNVLGTINNVSMIAAMAHAVGAILIVDATAAAGHIDVCIHDIDADFLFFSGHKMCGPTGTGVLYGRKKFLKLLEPGVVGGGIVNTVSLKHALWCSGPERFEAGTQNIGGVIGMGRAVDFITEIGLKNIRAHTKELTEYTQERLRSIPDVTLYSAPPEDNVGIVSFTIRGIHPHDIAQIVARENIAVRAGHHCAQPLHKALGEPATVRVSLYMYNTKNDIDALVESIRNVKKIFIG